jgi:hypothetical protein
MKCLKYKTPEERLSEHRKNKKTACEAVNIEKVKRSI